MMNLDYLKKRPIAHRGFHDDANPENSLGAFKAAVDNNFYIELDIQLSKDGEVMVFHDDSLKRMTGQEGRINDYTVKELKKFRLGNSEQVIPTFKEVLDLVSGKTLIVVELKNYKKTNHDLVTKMIEMLRAYNGLFVTKSFNPFIMGDIRKRAPEFIRGQLVCDFKDEKSLSSFNKFLLRNMITNIVSKPQFISTEYIFYTRKIRRLQRKGMCVLCWTNQNKEIYDKNKKIYDNMIFELFNPEGK